MSDTFDHADEAMDRFLSGEGEEYGGGSYRGSSRVVDEEEFVPDPDEDWIDRIISSREEQIARNEEKQKDFNKQLRWARHGQRHN